MNNIASQRYQLLPLPKLPLEGPRLEDLFDADTVIFKFAVERVRTFVCRLFFLIEMRFFVKIGRNLNTYLKS